MGYTKQSGKWADTRDVDFSPPAALDADALSVVIELGDRGTLRLVLDVTAVSSADTLDVAIETSREGVTWYSAGTFTQVTAVSTQRKTFVIDRFIRANYDVGGSAISIAFTLKGEAV